MVDVVADFRKLGVESVTARQGVIGSKHARIGSREKLLAVIRMEFQRIGGYKPTARDLMYLRKWKRGESIGFTMTASLKAKGLIPRTSKTFKGKKVLGPKYKGGSATRRNRRQ